MEHSQPHQINQPSFYVANADDPTELARLIGQARLMNQDLGLLLPENCDPATTYRVLDIASGPGGWAIDLGLKYPHMQVVGIDISEKVVNAGIEFAKGDGATNVVFRQMDVRKPLDFPDRFFDLVNARFIFACLLRSQWPILLRECVRVTRPGGMIRLIEFEGGFTNSLAVGTANVLFSKALYAAEMGFSPSGCGTGITPMLEKFLADAGVISIQQQPFALVAGTHGTEAARGWIENLAVFFYTLSPFIVKQKIATQDELDALAVQAMAEMRSEEFRGLVYLLSTWGRVPG